MWLSQQAGGAFQKDWYESVLPSASLILLEAAWRACICDEREWHTHVATFLKVDLRSVVGTHMSAVPRRKVRAVDVYVVEGASCRYDSISGGSFRTTLKIRNATGQALQKGEGAGEMGCREQFLARSSWRERRAAREEVRREAPSECHGARHSCRSRPEDASVVRIGFDQTRGRSFCGSRATL